MGLISGKVILKLTFELLFRKKDFRVYSVMISKEIKNTSFKYCQQGFKNIIDTYLLKVYILFISTKLNV